MEQLMNSLQTGTKLLPHDLTCLNKKVKRDINVDEGPVNTKSLFPTLGKIFSFFTGNLDSEAGQVVNNNYLTIKKLVKASKSFARMFNASLEIQRKHKQQIDRISKQVNDLDTTITASLGATNNNLAYKALLDNFIFTVMDLQSTVQSIFTHTDYIERNMIGPLSRDPAFLKSVSHLMNRGFSQKPNHLYLLKLFAKTNVIACHWTMTITYRFPVFQDIEYTPFFPIRLPKTIKNKFFTLIETPFMITWSSSVLMFNEQEYNQCETFNQHMTCKVPSQTQQLLDNCIYSMLNRIPWELLAQKCPLHYEKNPLDFIKFTDTHMVYFAKKEKFVSLLCSGSKVESRTITLQGAGSFNLPNGCAVEYDDNISMGRAQIGRKSDIFTEVDKSNFNLNLTKVFKILKVHNIQNTTAFWDQKQEEMVIMEGVAEVNSILDSIKFTPNQVQYTLFSLITYAIISTIFTIIILYLACVPGALIKCRTCCVSKN